MRARKALLLLFALALLAVPLASRAQPPATAPRIGYLSFNSPDKVGHFVKAFSEGLRALGWIEGQNVTVERRYAEGDVARLPGLAAGLVQLKVALIVAAGPNPVTKAAREATSTIPIVMVVGNSPMESGFVSSLRRPGGNVTGLAWDQGPEIFGKYPELLKEAMPRLSRVGVIIDPSGAQVYRTAAGTAASKLGVTLDYAEVRAPSDFENAFTTFAGRGVQAVMVYGSPFMFQHYARIAGLAAKHGLPDIYATREAVAQGGLMSYGVSIVDLYRRAPTYVDKILKGAKPADLPVEQPTKFELVINLKTAKALGLTIPHSVLAMADEVIQ